MRSLEPAVALRCADLAEELAGLGSWWMDAATQTLRWSPNMFKIYGLEPGIVPSLDYAMQFVHPDDRAAADSTLAGNLSGGSARSASRIIRPSGEVRYVEGRNACEYATDGSVQAVYGTVHDVTDRMSAERALAESEMRYRLLAENSSDVTACCRPDGTFSFLTSGIRNLLGFEVEELIGRKASDFIHPDDRPRVRQTFLEHMTRGSDAAPLRYEYRAIAKDGREVWLEANPSCVFDPGTGTLVEVQDILRDITARKALDRQLIVAKEAAEAAATVKAEFLANISHELRTPLTAIIGYSGLVAEAPNLPEGIRRHTERIESASRALLSFVTGLLDFSRLEAGRASISRRACSPAAIARECLDLLALQAEAKGISLEYLEAGVPSIMLIDPDAYRQVLVNLIGNAVKFTNEGFVRLTVEFNQQTEQLVVTVEDSGEGIAADQQGKLFQRFSQIDGSSTRSHQGAGLGLAICKGLVEAMGGGISVVSEPGVGSIFRFGIAASLASEANPANEAVEQIMAGVRILVVDDNAATRELVRAVLQSCDAEVSEAADGAAALSIATSQPFDLILLDLRMPHLDGRDVVAALRRQRGPNSDIPIIAFTASDHALLDDFCQQSGFDAVLAKPIVPRDLLAVVAQYTSIGESTT